MIFNSTLAEKHDVLGKRPLWCPALIQVPGLMVTENLQMTSDDIGRRLESPKTQA